MRRFLEDGKSNEEIIAKMQGWKPGVPMERIVDPVGATLARFQNMSAQEQNDLLNKLRAMKTK